MVIYHGEERTQTRHNKPKAYAVSTQWWHLYPKTMYTRHHIGQAGPDQDCPQHKLRSNRRKHEAQMPRHCYNNSH